MIHEYAIDPAVVISWARDRIAFRNIVDSIGIGKPRLMSEFPKRKNWRKQIYRSKYDAARVLNEMDGKRLEELTARGCRRGTHAYDCFIPPLTPPQPLTCV